MPAQYPNAVKTFTSRNAGDIIQPSHVNDLQDEVNAIEAGILNGTAPLNSSNSTVRALHVTANSTIGGNLVVTGTLSAGAFAFSSVVTADAQPRCKVVKASTQSVNNATWTALSWLTQEFNVGAMHSTGSNPSRITVDSTGVYLFGATVASTLNGQSGFVSLRKNGNTFIASRVKFLGNSSLSESGHVTTIEQMTSTGDYVECMVFQNTGAALEFGSTSSSRVEQPEFWAVKLW